MKKILLLLLFLCFIVLLAGCHFWGEHMTKAEVEKYMDEKYGNNTYTLEEGKRKYTWDISLYDYPNLPFQVKEEVGFQYLITPKRFLYDTFHQVFFEHFFQNYLKSEEYKANIYHRAIQVKIPFETEKDLSDTANRVKQYLVTSSKEYPISKTFPISFIFKNKVDKRKKTRSPNVSKYYIRGIEEITPSMVEEYLDKKYGKGNYQYQKKEDPNEIMADYYEVSLKSLPEITFSCTRGWESFFLFEKIYVKDDMYQKLGEKASKEFSKNYYEIYFDSLGKHGDPFVIRIDSLDKLENISKTVEEFYEFTKMKYATLYLGEQIPIEIIYENNGRSMK